MPVSGELRGQLERDRARRRVQRGWQQRKPVAGQACLDEVADRHRRGWCGAAVAGDVAFVLRPRLAELVSSVSSMPQAMSAISLRAKRASSTTRPVCSALPALGGSRKKSAVVSSWPVTLVENSVQRPGPSGSRSARWMSVSTLKTS